MATSGTKIVVAGVTSDTRAVPATRAVGYSMLETREVLSTSAAAPLKSTTDDNITNARAVATTALVLAVLLLVVLFVVKVIPVTRALPARDVKIDVALVVSASSGSDVEVATDYVSTSLLLWC